MVDVIPFRADLATDFESLNRRWIEQFFVVEAADLVVFNNPYSTVVEPGGQIFFVVEDSDVRAYRT